MKQLTIALSFIVSIVLCGCHDDDDSYQSAERWKVSVVNVDETADTQHPTLSWQASYESLTVQIQGLSPETRAVVVSTEDDWLTVASDTLATDGIVALTTTTNDTRSRRTATLVFTDCDNPQLKGTLTVTQLSQAEIKENGDPRDQLYVGYGYDIYKALESPMAVRTKSPIVDLALLKQNSSKITYEIIHDSHLSRTEMRYVTSNDIYAYGRDLSEQQTGDTERPIQGCTDNCKLAKDLIMPGQGMLQQQNFGHGSLEKAVAARVIDRGALLDLKRLNRAFLSDDFVQRLYYVYRATGEKRRQLIEQMLVDFGTHVILQTDLGGRIDYTFTMQKVSMFNSKEEMRQEIEYTLGRIADNERTTKNKTTSSSKSASGAITVTGGSAATRQRLMNDVGALSPTGQVDPSHITDWLASINYSSNPERNENLDVIHFELMPVWDVVDEALREDFYVVTLQMASRSDCQLPASVLGTDIYEIHPQQERDLFDFSAADKNKDASLCRLLYFEDEPVLQVCSEYVPKIRTDERVVIVYPIYRQHIRMNQGLFIGDGIHQPAYVGFSGAECYVNPIDSLAPGTYVDKVFYVNGNLLFENPSTFTLPSGKGRKVQDDMFYYRVDGKTYRHPIVKIGSKFWTRHDLTHRLGLTNNPNGSSTRTLDIMRDDVLYARFWHDVGRTVKSGVNWIWGSDQNTFYNDKPYTKWYFPRGADVANLYQFMGFNPKALFSGQVSGFNAQFNGYYGLYDLNNDRSFGDGANNVRYKGELTFFASRNGSTDTDAVLIALDKDYHFYIVENGKNGDWRENYYSVRPIRGYMFEYPTIATIEEHQ